jgi:hypothetical protein
MKETTQLRNQSEGDHHRPADLLINVMDYGRGDEKDDRGPVYVIDQNTR